MFTTLINWFIGLWTAIKNIWQLVWNFIRQSWLWLVGVIVGFIAITDKMIDFVTDAITMAVEGYDAMQMPTGANPEAVSGPLGGVFTIANTFFPLSEMVTLVSAMAVLMLAVMLYRFVKSWIPTVS